LSSSIGWSKRRPAKPYFSSGFGMKKQNLPVDSWIERFGDWLQVQGVL
jgi:hypothetical protein